MLVCNSKSKRGLSKAFVEMFHIRIDDGKVQLSDDPMVCEYVQSMTVVQRGCRIIFSIQIFFVFNNVALPQILKKGIDLQGSQEMVSQNLLGLYTWFSKQTHVAATVIGRSVFEFERINSNLEEQRINVSLQVRSTTEIDSWLGTERLKDYTEHFGCNQPAYQLEFAVANMFADFFSHQFIIK